MFKKSLAAVAVLGAFAASSFAADVTFYGKVDMGLSYQNAEVTDAQGKKDTTEALTLDSGVGLASRIGLKATEQLGNGDKVAFKLEGDFSTDDGELAKGKLWQREASLSYTSDWGKLYAGRYGSFSAAAGDTDIVMDRVESFDGGHKGVSMMGFSRMDNALTYFTPKFAGFQAAAMYSFKNDNQSVTGGDEDKGIVGNHEGHSDADHYAGIALSYDLGALKTAISYEQLIRHTHDYVDEQGTIKNQPLNDAKIVTFGGNYDFDMFKLYAGAQYFEGMDKVKDMKFEGLGADGVEGYALHVGSKFEALAGHFDTGIYYIDATGNAQAGLQDRDGEYFGINARYIYKLSNRTEIRSSVAYDHQEVETNAKDWEKDRYLACVSLTHNF